MLPTTLTLTGKAMPATNNVHKFVAQQGMTIVGASLCAASFTGAPTGFNIDINDDGAAALAALAANTAGTPGEWKSTALGGTAEPLHIARASVVGVDLNFTGGTTPAADYTLVLLYLPAAE